MKRAPLKKKVSKKLFSKNADRTHRANFRAVPMRGGYRI